MKCLEDISEISEMSIAKCSNPKRCSDRVIRKSDPAPWSTHKSSSLLASYENNILLMVQKSC